MLPPGKFLLRVELRTAELWLPLAPEPWLLFNIPPAPWMLCLAPVGLQLTAGNWSQFSVFISHVLTGGRSSSGRSGLVETTTKCVSVCFALGGESGGSPNML